MIFAYFLVNLSYDFLYELVVPFCPFGLKASIDNANSAASDSFISPRLEVGSKLAQGTEI